MAFLILPRFSVRVIDSDQHVTETSHPQPPRSERTTLQAQTDHDRFQRIPRGKIVHHLYARSSSIVQGVHNISLVLGFEATRDLEEEAFNGVRDTPLCPVGRNSQPAPSSKHL